MKNALKIVCFLVACTAGYSQQTLQLKDVVSVFKGVAGGSSPFTNWIKNEPISTNFRDAEKNFVLPDDFGNDRLPQALHKQARIAQGGYVLGPGFYELRARSFCIKAGTHAPGKGDAYLYAPLAGKQSDIVENILHQMEKHPEIEQYQVQYLLWALIARADFKQMNSDVKATAFRLMKPDHLVRINKWAIIGTAMNMTNTAIPRELTAVFDAEARMRQVFIQTGANLQQLESMAMLAGTALIDNPKYQRGRWSKHPEGYYVRYFPEGYARTRIQVYVPEQLTAVEFDATNDVATPANTGAQRLALSNVPYSTEGGFAELPPVIIAQTPSKPSLKETIPEIIKEAPPQPVPSPPSVLRPTSQDVCVVVINQATKSKISQATAAYKNEHYTTDTEGGFKLEKLPIYQTVSLTVKANGYREEKVRFETLGKTECQVVEIELVPLPPPPPVELNGTAVKEGDRIILQAIQFEQSKSQLLPPGKEELSRLVDWMKRYPNTLILLEGHTSNEGDHDLNVSLSFDRVASCKQFLVKSGVKRNRIKTMGHGPNRPLLPNDTPDNRVRNRRVELYIEKL
jgi:outer membrane protein OmpA-like peptidoglycan-associated protein